MSLWKISRLGKSRNNPDYISSLAQILNIFRIGLTNKKKVMDTFFNKQDYIDRCSQQVKNIGCVIDSLEYVKNNLPESGKQFNVRQIKALNEHLYMFNCVCSLRKDWYNTDNTYLCVQIIGYSPKPCNNAEIGHRKESEYFKNGKITDKGSVVKEINDKITQYKKAKERYETAPSKIDDFIGSYQHLYDVWKSVRNFDLPEIFIDSISQYPPIR